MSALGQDLIKASKAGSVNQVIQVLGSALAGACVLNEEESLYGYTALMRAAENGHLEIVKLLVETGADKEKEGRLGCTALIMAAEKGHLGVVKFLVLAGANKDKQGDLGYTALMSAAEGDHLKVVAFLVQEGATIEKEDILGSTALILAAGKGHLDVVKYLVQEAGADFRKKNQEGKSALEVANTEEIKSFFRLHAPVVAPSPHCSVSSAVTALTTSCTAAAPADTDPLPPPLQLQAAQDANRSPQKSSSSTATSLLMECERVLQQTAAAPQRMFQTQRIKALQAQLDGAEAADDFEQVVTLGTKLQALQQQSAQLPLSEEDYLTLPARYAELVRRMTDACRELMRARDYAALGPLSAKLKELRAVNLQAGSDTSPDPVLPDAMAGSMSSPLAVADAQSAHEEDDGALDPVLPAGVARFGTAVCIGSEEEESADSSSCDPVLPSDIDALRKA